MLISKQQALDYHNGPRPGKIEVTPTKPCRSQRDLNLAYTPGVAEPCLEIQKNPQDAFKYTGRGNLVAVLSNGTAVLGLGDIGALAGKPVMEGKAVLFKRFADVDVFDIEVNSHKVSVVLNGAGAAGIACAEHYVRLGVKRKNIMICDTKGVVYKGRKAGMNKYKERFAQETPLRTLADALVGADVFAGLSVKDAINQDMVR